VEFGRAIYTPLVITVAQSFITNIATAALLGLLLVRPFVPQTGPLRAVNHLDRLDGSPPKRLAPLSVKVPLLVLAIVIVASSAVGYVALGRYIAQQIVLTGTVLAAGGLFYLGVRAVTRRRDGATSPAEFFAVATETFFEKPWQLAERHAELFAELHKYYRVDPRAWLAPPAPSAAPEPEWRALPLPSRSYAWANW